VSGGALQLELEIVDGESGGALARADADPVRAVSAQPRVGAASVTPLSAASASAAPPLTAEQELAASRRDGPMLLAAAAGSGKTSVLVERYACAVAQDGLAPSRILAITFTERAAAELRQRVRARLRELDGRDLALDAEEPSVGTIHGFCARVLRGDPLAAGIAPGFRIVDEPAAARMRTASFAQALASALADAEPQLLDVASAYGPDRLLRIVTAAHSELRSRGEASPTLPTPPAGGTHRALAAHALLDRLLRAFGEEYEARKRAAGALDFDDLELRALTLLSQQPQARRRWAEHFDLLMVDEFQDVNRRQLELLLLLERENLFTVGDEWQSIYGFRHADVEIFRRREAQLAGRDASRALTRNFRGRPGVLAAVNAAFAQRFGERFRPLVPARAPAAAQTPAVELLLTDTDGWSTNQMLTRPGRVPVRPDRVPDRPVLGQGSRLAGAASPQAPAWRQAEARLIAGRVRELIDERVAGPAEIVVLLRSLNDVALYESALRSLGIPTASVSADLWQQPEVQDALVCLRALANPLDDLALYGLLASAGVGLSRGALALLARGARTEGRRGSLSAALRARLERPAPEGELDVGDEARLARFEERFAAERRRLGERSLRELVRFAAAFAGGGEAGANGTSASASVHALARLASDFEALEGRDLRRFVEHLDELAEARTPVGPQAPAPAGEAVRLMSIHAAKGLEFAVVCVADLGRAPGGRETPDLLLDGERIGLRVARLDGGEAESAFDLAQLSEQREQAAREEEDRILYVAMTRARELLLLAGAARFERWPEQGRGCPPIAWLAPALVEDLPQRLASASERRSGPAGPPRQDRETVRCVLHTPASDRAAMDAEPCELISAARIDPALQPIDPSLRSIDPSLRSIDPSLRSIAPSPRPHAPEDLVAGDGPGLLRPVEPSPLRPPLAPPALAPPVASPGAAGEPLSYTTLAQLERCGYRHYLERVLKLPEGAAPVASWQTKAARRGGRRAGADRARLLGEVVHRLLESWDPRRDGAPTAIDVGKLARGLGAAVDREQRAEIAAMLRGLAVTPLARRLAAASRLQREQPFCFALAPHATTITGAFDAIAAERDGGALVVDYKTGAVSEGEDLEALVACDYELQRLIYALAALRDGAAQVEVVHWFLHRPSEPVTARFALAELPELESRLSARVQAARERGFAVSSQPHRRLCASCPGRAGLCSWPEQMTMRER
jgi:ATP-dependent helicase/nuclease subunit A